MDTKQTAATNRLCLIDAYRGITMISMVLYHACYDYFSAFGINPQWIAGRGAFLWQQSICISFILVSGLVWTLGQKHALKRGLILLALGTVISLVTTVFMPSQAIYYGILTFMGFATLFMIPLDKLFSLNQKSGKNNPVLTELIHIIICLLLFALTKHISGGYIGTRYHRLVSLPDSLYAYPFLTPFGLPAHGFTSADYFPLIPWLFMYLTGYHAGKIISTCPSILKRLKKRIPLLSKLGTKSLLVYIIHQPVCYAVVWLICSRTN
ncbi:MAG: DUF1624 domain-containing protein [Lachnospiraceae bacterium]|nr:DUF1624 domain-containing protein [Lachnospiraceae bacterium]